MLHIRIELYPSLEAPADKAAINAKTMRKLIVPQRSFLLRDIRLIVSDLNSSVREQISSGAQWRGCDESRSQDNGAFGKTSFLGTEPGLSSTKSPQWIVLPSQLSPSQSVPRVFLPNPYFLE